VRIRELEVGRWYAARVSGRIVPVRLESVYECTDWKGRRRKRCVVHNMATGRTLRVSPQRLLRPWLERGQQDGA
jgi:hypothetical protein